MPQSSVPLPRDLTPQRAAVLLATVLAFVAALVVVPAGRADAATAVPAGRYYPLSPVRVLDTDTTGQPFRTAETRTIDLSKAFTAPASAVVLNLTAAGGTGDSFQTVFPTGTARPTTSNLNELAGTIRANSVTVAVGQGGSVQNDIDLYNNNGTVRLIVDVTGYYGAGGNVSDPGTGYVPLAAPVRLFDSRYGIGPLTNTYPRNVGIATVDYGSPAVNKIIRAVAVNITVTDPSGPGYLTLWNGTGIRPSTSSVNFTAGQTVANFAVVPVHCFDADCSKVTFSIYNAISASTQVIADIQGMYATPGYGGSTVFSPMAPTRITDTREGRPWAALGRGAAGTVTSSGWGTTARAAALNVTAVLPQAATYLTVWAAGSGMSTTSSVNAVPGDIIPNAVQTRIGSSGAGFNVYNNAGGINVVVDVAGVFLPDTSPSATPAAKSAAVAPAGAISSR